ncbi:putative F-box protein [Ophiophagus hannah]|uniref:Putative F-box protein n=1 Tax=Ophiophagus hannah TaxID=8665 RepID=V8N2X7_OPHHA|nr:putative F-box protein [Ophiophagus hannah]
MKGREGKKERKGKEEEEREGKEEEGREEGKERRKKEGKFILTAAQFPWLSQAWVAPHFMTFGPRSMSESPHESHFLRCRGWSETSWEEHHILTR